MVEKATLDLGYAQVTAPISGLVGTTQVKPGNLVGRGQNTLLTTISQIDPILFRVGVTEADYMRVVRRAPDRVGAEPRLANIELTLSDGTKYPNTPARFPSLIARWIRRPARWASRSNFPIRN